MGKNGNKKALTLITDDNLFDLANQACEDLRYYLVGSIDLEREVIEAHKALIREASSRSIYFFGKAVLGFSLFTKQTHKRWAEDLLTSFLKCKKLGRLKPRGTFKTTLYGETFLLWLWACVSKEIRIAYTSANQDLLDEVGAHIDTYVAHDSESLYAFVFGVRRDKKAKNTQNTFNLVGSVRKGKEGDGKGNSLMLRTAGGSTNGLHPHVIIIDDPMDVKDRQSEAIRKQKRNWYDSLHPLLVPFHAVYRGIKFVIEHLMLISTRWHLDDLVNHIQTTDDTFEFETEGIYAEGYDENGKRNLQFPELISYEKIEDLRKRMSEMFFSCQYLNDPLPDGLQLFPKDKLKFLRPDQIEPEIGSNYIFLDPAKGTETGAYPALIVVNRCSGRNTFFDAIDDKLGLDQILALGAKLAKIYACKLWVFESNGTTLLKSSIYRSLKDAEYHCGVIDIHETRNKAERIAMMQPDLLHNENYFMSDYEERYPEMMKQITFYPAYGPVDFPDICEKAVSYLSKKAVGAFPKGGGSSSGSATAKGSMTGSIKKSTDW